jgi:hypothetical protein
MPDMFGFLLRHGVSGPGETAGHIPHQTDSSRIFGVMAEG